MSDPHFACREQRCAEEISYPADMLRVYEDEAWCEDCWEHEWIEGQPRWNELPNFVPEADRRVEELEAEVSRLRESERWKPVGAVEQFPPRHENVWCLNRNGRQFEGRVCYGMHEPFFTYPRGDGSPSNTAPAWIDVIAWRDLPEPLQEIKNE